MTISRVPFLDVFADESGGNIKTPQGEYKKSGRFPVVDQGKSLVAGYVDDESRLCGDGRPAIVFGDHTRCVKYTDFPFCMGADGVKILRPKIEADLKYLYYYLRQLNLSDAGYSRHFKYLKRSEVVLLPLPEQRRIAAILDQADALRAKRREILAQLDSLTQSIFIEMFGDPVTNPKRWPRIKLGDLIASGPQNGLYKHANDYGTGTLILRIDGFYDGAVTKFATLKRVRLSDSERDLYELHPGEIVINRVNSMEFLGKSAIIPDMYEPVVFESNMMRFDLQRDIVEPGYVIQFLQTEFIKGQITTSAKHAVNQSSINQQDIKSFIINIPPFTLQSAFVDRGASISKLKINHHAALAELDALFASLQHQAFRGEL